MINGGLRQGHRKNTVHGQFCSIKDDEHSNLISKQDGFVRQYLA